MTRALAVCRWCGTPPAPSTDPQGRGRPATFCSDLCRTVYRRTFGVPDYAGAVRIVDRCGRCGLDGAETDLPGPVRSPGAWKAAQETVAALLHSHPVLCELVPIESGGQVGALQGPRLEDRRGVSA